jgi:hypothetical protein
MPEERSGVGRLRVESERESTKRVTMSIATIRFLGWSRGIASRDPQPRKDHARP